MAESGFTFVPSFLEQLRSPNHEGVVQIAWSPGGLSLAAVGATGQILLWRRAGERYVLSAQSDLIDGGKSKPLCLAWTSAGLLVSGWSDGRLRVYQSDPFKFIRQSDDLAGGPVLSVAMHPFSSLLVTAFEGEPALRLWNAARKKLEPIHEVPSSEKQIWGVAWHPGGKHLASCGADETVRVWRYEEKPDRLVEAQDIASPARQVVWSPDPDLLLARIEPHGRVSLWRTRQRGAATLRHPSEVSSVAFSPDGSVCISKSSDGKIPIWKSPSGELLGYVEDKKGAFTAPSWPLPVELAVRPAQSRSGWSDKERASAPSSTSHFELANVDPDDQCIRVWRLQREERVTIQVEPPSPIHRQPDLKPSQKTSAEAYQRVKLLKESVHFAGNRDQRTVEDSLGFKTYVEAVADFLTDSGTTAPLTLSIEGEWGAGKSSFMEQVKKRIRDGVPGNQLWPLRRFIQGWRGKHRLILSFNVWRHDKEEAVWAAFALELLRQLRAQCGWKYQIRGWFLLLSRRAFSLRSLFSALRLAAWAVLLVVCSYVVSDLLKDAGHDSTAAARKQFEKAKLPEDPLAMHVSSPEPSRFVEISDFLVHTLEDPHSLAILVLVMTLFLNAKQLLGNPIDLELGKYLRSTGWEDRVAVIEQFHEDFDQIVQDYSGNRRVYVFIDDLDRCEVPRAADLMQAINLLISEDPNILFVLGMDRLKVAAGFAVKFEKTFQYLETEDNRRSRRAFAGLTLGYEFIEKFIQIPFQLPRPSRGDIERLLLSLSPTTKETEKFERGTDASFPPKPGPILEPDKAEPSLLPTFSGAAISPLESHSFKDSPPAADLPSGISSLTKEELSLEIKGDSRTVRETALLVAPALDFNPRRVKQFVNSFRLRAFIAARTGLLAGKESRPGKVTFYQLGKLVAISLRWPLLLAEAREHPYLLRNLEAIAKGREKGDSELGEVEKRWMDQERLMDLLRAESSSSAASLATLNIGLLLMISPPVEAPIDPATQLAK